MDVAIIGGDLRNAYLARLLAARGLDARTVGLERAGIPGLRTARPEEVKNAACLVMNAPPQMGLAENPTDAADILAGARKDATLIFAGPQPAPELAGGHVIHDLTAREGFLQGNAALTAEGAIYAAMGETADSLLDARCLVIGWGRIGRVLGARLAGLGAKVTVASRSEKSRRQAQGRGLQVVPTQALEEALGEADLIFSTAPALVLDEERLARVRPQARIIDLASAPYGVDLAAAECLGLRAWREPGLPGRYCPLAAARVLAREVLGIYGERGGEAHA